MRLSYQNCISCCGFIHDLTKLEALEVEEKLNKRFRAETEDHWGFRATAYDSVAYDEDSDRSWTVMITWEEHIPDWKTPGIYIRIQDSKQKINNIIQELLDYLSKDGS